MGYQRNKPKVYSFYMVFRLMTFLSLIFLISCNYQKSEPHDITGGDIGEKYDSSKLNTALRNQPDLIGLDVAFTAFYSAIKSKKTQNIYQFLAEKNKKSVDKNYFIARLNSDLKEYELNGWKILSVETSIFEEEMYVKIICQFTEGSGLTYKNSTWVKENGQWKILDPGLSKVPAFYLFK